jgi:6-phosphogluconolactonase
MTSDGGSNPTYLAFHPNKKFLYAVNESGASSKVLAFSIDAGGALAKLSQGGEAATAPGQGPPHLSVHASGNWIYAAHYGSGHTTVHPIMAGGGVGVPASNDKTATNEAHQAVQDPTGKFLFVPCRTPNYVAQYRIDAATGALTANNPARVTAPTAGTGPRHMAFHPNGKWAYLLGELNGHVVSYDYDGTTGLLANPQDVSIRAGETSAAHILVHPSGRFAFASLRSGNEIATLAIDAQTGRLTVTAHQTSMISGPRDFTVDASGRFLLVANETNGTVKVFDISDTDGSLTFRSSIATDGISKPQFVGTLVLP